MKSPQISPDVDAVIVIAVLQARIKALEESQELAWGLIANSYGGDWKLASKESGWVEAAERWRDLYHEYLRKEPATISNPEE